MTEADPLRLRLLSLPVFARELIAGGVAGGLAKTCVAPLERTKILLQTTGTRSSVLETLQGIVQREGLLGLFRGNGASVARIVPYAAIHFGSYEHFRRLFLEDLAPRLPGTTSASSSPVWDLLAGSASGATAVMATYPLDLVRTRLAWASEQRVAAAPGGGAAPHHPRHTIRTVLRRTLAEEGAQGLFRGVVPTLLGILPYAGLKFYVYQTLKGWYRSQHAQQQQQQQQQAQGPHSSSSSSSTAGSAALSSGSSSDPAAMAAQAATSSSSTSSSSRSGKGRQEKGGRGDRLPVPVMLTFGGAAGLLAQTVTYPLDVIRRQMQVQGLQQLHADEGPAAVTQQGTQHQPSSSVSSSSSSSSSSSNSSSRSARSMATAPAATAAAGGSGVAWSPAGSQQRLHTSAAGGSCASSSSVGHNAAGGSRARASGLPSALAARMQHLAAATRCIPNSSSRRLCAQAAAAPQQHQLHRVGMVETTRQLVSAGGWYSLFRGLSINYMKVVPSTAIGFTLYDALKSYLDLTSNL